MKINWKMNRWCSSSRNWFVTVLMLVSGQVAMSQDNDAPVIPPHEGRNLNIRLITDGELTGWTGNDQYWSAEGTEAEGTELVGRSEEPLDESTYLSTEAEFSDVRLIFDFKRVEGAAASGIGLWGEAADGEDERYGYAGHVVVLPPEGGIREESGRGDLDATLLEDGDFWHLNEWNRIELLAQGNRIRLVVNGRLVIDWRDPQPDQIDAGPIALKLPASEQPQEIRFRGLRLEMFPEERLTTLLEEQPDSTGAGEIPERYVDAEAEEQWTRFSKVVIPQELLDDFFHPKRGLKHFGIRAEERESFYAILQKVRELDLSTLKKAAAEFRHERQKKALDGKYRDAAAFEFPTFVDLYRNPELYHGKLVTLRGHVRKLIRVPAGENPYGIEEYWEAWLFDQHAQGNPAVVIAPALAEGLPEGTELVVDHVFATGYFVKNYGFEAQDAMRFAPAFIAKRIEYKEPAAATNPFDLGLSAKTQLLIAAVVILIFGRFAWRRWKKAKEEEAERRAVRNIVSDDDTEPRFDNVVDDGGVPRFPDE